jgi:hypothetical protein
MQNCAYHADWSLDAMLARTNAPHVCQRSNKPDCSMTAHAEIADIIKEDHASGAQ